MDRVMEWDAIIAVNYSDQEDTIVAESNPLGDDLEALIEEWREERADREPNTMANVHCLAKESCADDLEALLE